MLAQCPERFAKRDIERELQATEEDRAENQDATRGSNEAAKCLPLGLPHRSTGAARGHVKQTKRRNQQQGDAKAAAPGHRLDPGHQQLGSSDQRRGFAPVNGLDERLVGLRPFGLEVRHLAPDHAGRAGGRGERVDDR